MHLDTTCSAFAVSNAVVRVAGTVCCWRDEMIQFVMRVACCGYGVSHSVSTDVPNALHFLLHMIVAG